jgi:hypothetical protein
MKSRTLTLIAASSLMLGSAAAALAAESAVASPAQTDQLTLPAGKLTLDAFLEANLSKSVAFKPVSLSPDLWYGATDDITLGLVHSSVGATGFLGGVGDSLCLSGSSNGCAHFYDDVGADVRYRLMTPLAIDAGLYILDIKNPFFLALKVGIDGRWRFDRFALEVLPSLFFGFTNRSLGNKDTLSVPITASYEVVEKVLLSLQTGVQLRLEQTSDDYRIPLSLAGRYQFTPAFGLGLAFTLPALIGPSSRLNGFDARTLMLGGSYAF